jgi:hypothetical protein
MFNKLYLKFLAGIERKKSNGRMSRVPFESRRKRAINLAIIANLFID